MDTLWAPWRAQYILGETKESGCLFCNRFTQGVSRQQHVLYVDADVLVMLKLSFIHGVSQTDIARMWQCDQTRVSRTLSTARSQIAAETMRAIRAAEPDLQIDWDDFKRLCAYGIEI